MSPRFVACDSGWVSEYKAKIIDTQDGVCVCLCADRESAEVVARALNREMMQ